MLLPALAIALLSGCDTGHFSVDLQVVDERGAPVAGAWVRTPDQDVQTDADGEARLRRLDRPVMALVEADGALTEPVPLGRWDAEAGPVQVRLLDAEGRIVVHSTGDVMLGRRYVRPTEGEPLLDPQDDGASARAIVADLAPALGVADLVTANLETVVGDFPDEAAYPGKRWLLLTPPSALAALDELGVDLAGLANNHQRDWMDVGVQSTLAELDDWGLPRVGAGRDADEAAEAVILEVQGRRVGVLAFTSVNGDYVNDQYPGIGEEPPEEIPEEDAFAWEERTWGVPELGIPEEARRIGEAWALIVAQEELLVEADQALLWESASAIYPELQDWTARRGHGGANEWTNDSPDRIAELKSQCDLVVVQLHMGFQFAAAPSAALREVAAEAIAAGADLVIGHHPHVLQGAEWIDGRLVVWSLGNFAFDQDFLSTFSSAFLRTVWEGDQLVQARLIPLFLDRYRPVPIADGLAARALRGAWERSVAGATAERGSDLGVRTVPGVEAGQAPSFQFEHSTAVLGQDSPWTETLQVEIPVGGLAALPGDRLVRLDLSDAPPAGVEVGRSLGGLGDFEDQDGDSDAGEVPGWTWDSEDIVLMTRGALSGQQSLSLLRNGANEDRVSARMIARIAMPAHHLYADPEGLVPLDGEARYSLRLLAERHGPEARASLRLAMYHFDDLDPTEDPESILLRELELDFPVERAPGEILLDLPDEALLPVDGLQPNAVLLYVSLYPPERDATRVMLDDIELIEWRAADQQPEGWGALDWLRDGDGQGATVNVSTRGS